MHFDVFMNVYNIMLQKGNSIFLHTFSCLVGIVYHLRLATPTGDKKTPTGAPCPWQLTTGGLADTLQSHWRKEIVARC